MVPSFLPIGGIFKVSKEVTFLWWKFSLSTGLKDPLNCWCEERFKLTLIVSTIDSEILIFAGGIIIVSKHNVLSFNLMA